MQKISQKRTIFEFDTYGKVFEIKAPSVRELNDFQKEVTATPGDELALSIAMLEKLGLEKDLGWDMEAHHLKQMMESICGQKKS